MIYTGGQTLCWYCKNATGNCSWSSTFKPVKGWKAKPTKIKINKDTRMSSYHVMACPEFDPDPKCKDEFIA